MTTRLLWGMFENQSPQEKSKKRSENTMGAPSMNQAAIWSRSKKISEDANTELRSILAGLCESVKEVKGTMDSFRDVMKWT